jgi:hypothetical protein
MLCRGIPIRHLETLVYRASSLWYDGNICFKTLKQKTKNSVSFTLTVYTHGTGSKVSQYTGRRIRSACWHAHRDVLMLLFHTYPNASISTTLATYKGLSGFLAAYPDTADTTYHLSTFGANSCKCDEPPPPELADIPCRTLAAELRRRGPQMFARTIAQLLKGE